jgi:VanZ family protein
MHLLLKIWRPLCHVQFWVMLTIYTVLGLSGNPGSMVPLFNDLLMHFCGYLVAGISISFAWPRTHYWQRGLFLLCYSIAIEIGQHFLPPRTFSGMDILANLSGIVAGLLLFRIMEKFAPDRVKPFVR